MTNFRCNRCGRTGPREESRRERKPTPSDSSHFVDQCPNCKSTDIEVFRADRDAHA